MTSYAPPRAIGVIGGIQEPEPAESVPRWRKLIALVGWGVPIAVLVALNIWGVLQLAQGPSMSAPVIETTPTTAAPFAPRPRPMLDDTATAAGATIDSPAPEAFPEVPSVVTSPPPEAFPEVPTMITSPPPMTEVSLPPGR
ncbi:hypothetical protein A5745_10325 [Mycobacterium sp. IS-2888]|uniref:hypothetical protein n=1 Tax=Mycobacterium sp. IS-2888 TaxID=1834159 RepID=UPI00096F1C76|nr:hypothetical protein [Mycobacterium sp. IS-2888]OMC47851.1 hypothetical protein A5745_10325 [Mycobacterium sp. IS-2888]